MGKRLPHTPYSKIQALLRRLWMWSRERAAALKRAQGVCERCGVKVGRANLEVHHIHGSGLKQIIELIRTWLLCPPERLECLCKECHREGHDGD